MNKWSCEIERIDNGFIMRNTSDNDIEPDVKTLVFEDKDMCSDFESEAAPLQEMFYTIMDFFGVYNSKHNEKRLEIEFIDN